MKVFFKNRLISEIFVMMWSYIPEHSSLLQASIKASVNLTLHALTAIWWNNLCNFVFFVFFHYSKNFVCCTNWYLRKEYASIQIFRCHQHKTMVSDNFNRNVHHCNMKKVEHNSTFSYYNERGLNRHLKYTAILIWSL